MSTSTTSHNTATDKILETIDLLDISNVVPKDEIQAMLNEAVVLFQNPTNVTDNNDKRMHINFLSDKCLAAILSLKHFTLQLLICKLRPICRRWKLIIESWICAPKECLKLFGSIRDVRYYAVRLFQLNLVADEQFKLDKGGQHDLILPNLGNRTELFDQLFVFLRALFPNLQHLVIAFDRSKLCDKQPLAKLIALWPHLTRLSLFTKEYVSKIEANSPLYLTINSMNKLTHLDLVDQSVRHQHRPNSEPVINSLSQVLAQLTHLALDHYDNLTFGQFLSKLEPNLRSLRLNGLFFYSMNSLKESLKQSVATGITELCMSRIRNLYNFPIIEFVCEYFPRLERLELDFKEIQSFDSAVLANLSKLVHLKVLSLHSMAFESSIQLFALSTVTTLELANFVPLANVPLASTLGVIFPNLQHLNCLLNSTQLITNLNYNQRLSYTETFFRGNLPNLKYCRLYWSHCPDEYMGRHTTGSFQCNIALESISAEAFEQIKTELIRDRMYHAK